MSDTSAFLRPGRDGEVPRRMRSAYPNTPTVQKVKKKKTKKIVDTGLPHHVGASVMKSQKVNRVQFFILRAKV